MAIAKRQWRCRLASASATDADANLMPMIVTSTARQAACEFAAGVPLDAWPDAASSVAVVVYSFKPASYGHQGAATFLVTRELQYGYTASEIKDSDGR